MPGPHPEDSEEDHGRDPSVHGTPSRPRATRARNRLLWTSGRDLSPSVHGIGRCGLLIRPFPPIPCTRRGRAFPLLTKTAGQRPSCLRLHSSRESTTPENAHESRFSLLWAPENVHNPRIGAQARGLPAKRKSWRRMGRGLGEAERERSGDVAGLGVRWERNPNGSGAVRDEGGIGAGARLDRERSESVPDWG